MKKDVFLERAVGFMRDAAIVALGYALCGAMIVAEARADSPKFITGSMMDRRNGLTDEQYEILWKLGRTPQITPNVARDWVFRANRYQNVTNWLDICGKDDDFAALSYDLQDKNFKLEETNAVLVATNSALTATCIRLADEVVNQWENYTNQLAQTTAYSNAYVIAKGIAESATAKIHDEIADLQAKIVKYKEYQTKYPLLKSIFEAMITDAENRIKILQALTGR